MLIGEGVSCRIWYSVVSLLFRCKLKRINYLGWGRERKRDIFLVLITRNYIYVVSVWRRFFFLLVPRMGYNI